MRNVSVSVHIFTRPNLRDRCWKGRVKGKITSIAFFHASFADFSLPFQLCRIRSVYNALVNPHFDYYRGWEFFSEWPVHTNLNILKPNDIFLHKSALPSEVNPLTNKASFLNLGGLRPSLGECGCEKMRFQQCGIRMDWVWEPFLQNLKDRNISKVVLRETRPPTPSYYSSYDVWYSRYVSSNLKHDCTFAFPHPCTDDHCKWSTHFTAVELCALEQMAARYHTVAISLLNLNLNMGLSATSTKDITPTLKH